MRSSCFLSLFLLTLAATQVNAQNLIWQEALGGSGADLGNVLKFTANGNFLVAGSTRSYDGLLEADRKTLDLDAWLLKVNPQGQVLWQHAYGGSHNEEAKDLVLLPGGDCVLAGYTDSKEYTHGERDVFVVRTDGLGRTRWARAYGGTGNDVASAILALPDGGLIVAGETGSKDKDVHHNHGGIDCWVLRLDDKGNILWEHSFGGKGNDLVEAAMLTHEGNILLAASSDSDQGDVSGNHGKTDIWLFEIDKNGSLNWQRCLGGSSFDEPHALVTGPDGLYYLAGTTFSDNGDILGHIGGGDYWLACLGEKGRILWNHCYGGTGDEGATGICILPNNEILLCGTSRSRDGQRSLFRGVYDGWVIKTTAQGRLIWEKTLGGFQNDAINEVGQLENGDYLCVGYSGSHDGDLAAIPVNGSNDLYMASIREPDAPPKPETAHVTELAGYLIDKQKQSYQAGVVLLINDITHTNVSIAHTDTTTGLYRLTVPNPSGASINVLAPGFMMFQKSIGLRAEEVGTEVRLDVLLDRITVGAKLNLYHFYFDVNKFDIKPESKPELELLAYFMTLNPTLRIQITGHTADTDGRKVNMEQLSSYRAVQIKAFLQSRGINGLRIETVGRGMEEPLFSNNTELGRARNRRVEIKVIGL